MSLWSKVSDGLEIAQLCATGLEVIRELVKHKPNNVLDLITKVTDGVFDAITSTRSPADVRHELLRIKDGLPAEDRAADKAGDDALDKRFPPGDD